MDQPVIQPHIMGDRIAIKSELAHLQGQTKLADKVNLPIFNCRIPDDCIDSKRYPLFMARAVLQELIESLQTTGGAKPC